jgi:hypothetical protein
MMYAEEAFNSTSVYTQLLHLASKKVDNFPALPKIEKRGGSSRGSCRVV